MYGHWRSETGRAVLSANSDGDCALLDSCRNSLSVNFRACQCGKTYRNQPRPVIPTDSVSLNIVGECLFRLARSVQYGNDSTARCARSGSNRSHASVILAVGAPVVNVISGMFGAALPVVLTYGVMEYSDGSEPS
jgi:hypothetical protein